ncbi:phenylalanine 4-monooxygenase, partial [Photobacterium sp. OFAV2-7]|nr:phenylalanine 4-monooxygenase [Photobacterium sp. OFAV2-7]
PGETEYAVTSDKPVYRAFDPVDIMRTPYRIDIMQPIYFVLDSIDQLYELAQKDIMSMVLEAKSLGLHEPMFPPKDKEIVGDYV